MWCSMSDAPSGLAMTETQLEQKIKEEDGDAGLRRLPMRLKRAREWGTSLIDHVSAEDACEGNSAGPRGAELTLEQIWEQYVEPTLDGGGTKHGAPRRSSALRCLFGGGTGGVGG